MKKVKKLLLLLAIPFMFQNSFSQSNTSIEGKWRMICISDNQMYYNVKKDSLWLSDEILKDFDSTSTQLYKNLWKGIQYNFLIFGKKGAYQEITEGKLTANGTFSIDKKTSKLKLETTRDKIPVKSEHHFQIKGNELYLVEHGKKDVTYVFEKVKQ